MDIEAIRVKALQTKVVDTLRNNTDSIILDTLIKTTAMFLIWMFKDEALKHAADFHQGLRDTIIHNMEKHI